MGGHSLIAKDFVGPEVEDEEVRELAKMRRHAILRSWKRLPSLLRHRRVTSHKRKVEDPEKDGSLSEDAGPVSLSEKSIPTESNPPSTAVSVIRQPIPSATRHVAFHDPDVHIASPSITEIDISRVASPAPTLTHADTMTHVDNITPAPSVKLDISPEQILPKSPVSSSERRTKRIRAFLSSLISPPSLAIIISFPVALIKPLKALFVPTENSPIPNAPDGQPPLAFIQDAATFIGAAAVPLGLICLGSALARLNVPMNRWRTLPLGAIFSLAVAKLIITPVLGVLICEGLTHAGVIDPSDKVLRFVCM